MTPERTESYSSAIRKRLWLKVSVTNTKDVLLSCGCLVAPATTSGILSFNRSLRNSSSATRTSYLFPLEIQSVRYLRELNPIATYHVRDDGSLELVWL